MHELQKRDEGTTALTLQQSPRCLELIRKINDNDPRSIIPFANYERGLTVASAFKQGTQLSVLKQADKVLLVESITKLLKRLVSSLNTKETIDSYQAADIVATIMKEYWGMKLEELIYVFNQASMGRLGKDYNRVDKMTVCMFIDNYLKSDERITILETQHKEAPVFEKPEPMTEAEQKRFDEIQQYLKLLSVKRNSRPAVDTSALAESSLYTLENFIRELTENLPGCSDEELYGLMRECRKQGFPEALELVQKEMESRKKDAE